MPAENESAAETGTGGIMEHFLYLAAIVIGGLLAARFVFQERRNAARLRQERNEIEGEERRLFEFLHGLGAALQKDASPGSVHRYVVEGVAEVIGAEAGILYRLDEGSGLLAPVYQTKKVAPVVEAPEEVLQIADPEEAVQHYRAFLRLSTVEPGQSFIGRVFEAGDMVHTADLTEHEFFKGVLNDLQKDEALLAVPLVYGSRRVGALALTRRGDRPFTSNDREVFASVAEQSAFAIGSAAVHAEAHEKRRLESELQQASEIQRVLLPRSSPELSDYNVAAAYRAARHVSGDYYDYVRVDEDRYGVAIGDVCGKGIAASLIVAMCRSNLRALSSENISPASVLHKVNQLICPDIKEDMFVSLLYLILERGSNEVSLARAGHEPPLVLRKDSGSIESIEVPGMAAGVDPGGNVFKRSVKDHRIEMATGDILVLYTDGIIEAVNREDEEFGLDRLRNAILGSDSPDADQVVQAVMDEVGDFCKGMAQSDDITLIAVEKR